MVWEWTGCCWDEGDSVAGWLSAVLGHPVRCAGCMRTVRMHAHFLGAAALKILYCCDGCPTSNIPNTK